MRPALFSAGELDIARDGLGGDVASMRPALFSAGEAMVRDELVRANIASMRPALFSAGEPATGTRSARPIPGFNEAGTVQCRRDSWRCGSRDDEQSFNEAGTVQCRRGAKATRVLK